MDLPTYTNIWRIEKRLYKIYDFRLPFPLPIGQIAVFVAVTVPYITALVAAGLPIDHRLFWLYVLPPLVVTWLATRPVLENKRLPELLASQLRYLAEPRSWCRLIPVTEADEIVIVGRVWHRAASRARPAVGAARAPRSAAATAGQPKAAWPVDAPGHVRVPGSVAAAGSASAAGSLAAAASVGAAGSVGAAVSIPGGSGARATRAAAAAAAPRDVPWQHRRARQAFPPAVHATAKPTDQTELASGRADGASTQEGTSAQEGAGRERVRAMSWPEARTAALRRAAAGQPFARRGALEVAHSDKAGAASRDRVPASDTAPRPVTRQRAAETPTSGPPASGASPAPAAQAAASGSSPAASTYAAATGGSQASVGQAAASGSPRVSRAAASGARPAPVGSAAAAAAPPASASAAAAGPGSPLPGGPAAGVTPAASAAGAGSPLPGTPAASAAAAGPGSRLPGGPAVPEGPAAAGVAPAASAAAGAGSPLPGAPARAPATAKARPPFPVPAWASAAGPAAARAAGRAAGPTAAMPPHAALPKSAAAASPAGLSAPPAGPSSTVPGPAPAAPRGRRLARHAAGRSSAASGHEAPQPSQPRPSQPQAPAEARAVPARPPRPQAPARQEPARPVERVVRRSRDERAPGWHRRAKVVVGGLAPGRIDPEEHEKARCRVTLAGPHRIVVLGCTSGAGQTATALMLGQLLATLRAEPVAALDLNPGDRSLTRQLRVRPVATVGGLLADARPAAMAARGIPAPREPRLEVIASGEDRVAVQGLDDNAYLRLADMLGGRYLLTVVDPAAATVARVLRIADQLVLVAPASADAPRAVAMTHEWLDTHGHSELAARAVTVINGVSKRSMADVVQAENVARGRSRAIVRVPWDDQLDGDRGPVPGPGQLRPQTRHAYTALGGVSLAGFAVVAEEVGISR